MNVNNFLRIALVASLLFLGCDKPEKSGESSSATPKSTPQQGGSKTVVSKSGKPMPQPNSKTGEPTKESSKSPASPAKEDAESLKTLDFPALKKMVAESQAKLTMVPVWATWCVPCIKEMPHLAEFYEKQHKNGLEIIALCVGDKTDEDEAEQIADKVLELKSPFHHYVLSDDSAEAFFKAFGEGYGGTLPATLVLNSQGEVVVFTRNGWTDKSLNEIIVPKLK